MLEPVAAEVVRDGQQEVVMVVVLGAESLHACSTSRLCAAICSGVAASSAVVVGDHVERDVGLIRSMRR